MNYLTKYKLLFLSPRKFFRSVQSESNYNHIILFFAIPYVIIQLTYIFLTFNSTLEAEGNLAYVIAPIQIIIGMVYILGLPYLLSGIVHLGVLIVHGKNGFFDTFKPITYANVILIPWEVTSAIIWWLVPVEITFSNGWFDLLTTPEAILHISIILISYAHLVYVEVTGLAYFQKMSKGRALFAAVLPIVLWIVMLIVLTSIIFTLIHYYL